MEMEGEQPIFRRAEEGDIPVLADMLFQLFSSEADFTADRETQSRAISRIISSPEIGIIYVLSDGKKPIACATVLNTISTATGGACGLLEDVFVLPEYRRRGYARHLLNMVVEESRRRGLTRLTLLTERNNSAGRALYEAMSFTASTMMPYRLHIAPI